MFRKLSLALGIGAALCAGVAHLPLGWVAPSFMPDGIGALDYRGTVWNGSISGLPIFDAATVKVHPLRRSVDLKAGDGASYASGLLRRTSAENLRLRLPLSALPLTDGRLQGLKGRVDVDIATADYTPTGCTAATGTVRTDILQRNGGTIDWTGPELSGPIRCEDGALLAELTGRDAAQQIDILLRLQPDGVYRAEVSARTTRVEADAVLPMFGFTRDGSVFRLTEQGRWR
jgi:hypothetical protein